MLAKLSQNSHKTLTKLLLTMFLLISVSANDSEAQTLPIQKEPCWDGLPGPPDCTVTHPSLESAQFQFDACPGCGAVVDYYYMNCGGWMYVQIVSIYITSFWGNNNILCFECHEDDDIWAYAYVEIFDELSDLFGIHDNYWHVKEASCRKFVSTDTNPFDMPLNTSPPISGNNKIASETVTVYGYWTTCESACCIYEVALANEQNGDDLIYCAALWDGNRSTQQLTDCDTPETGCVGGCGEVRFEWGSSYGMRTGDDLGLEDLWGIDGIPPTTGVELSEYSMNIEVVPNPNNGHFNLIYNKTSDSSADYTIEVYDLTGRLVHNCIASSAELHYSMDLNLGAGLYILKLLSNDSVIGSTKIIIE